jgi:sarcosine oxidase subunit beta
VKDILFPKRLWHHHDLRSHYDVVIVGGGAHGLATAYYLAKNHGVKNVAVLEKSYIGAGGSGRNTTIVRSNYRTPEGAEFYNASVKLYESLSAELDFNVMFSQHGHLTLAHSDRGMITAAERAEVNKVLGIESYVADAAEVKRLCPQINIGQDVTWPIVGALYHPPGGIIRHDAVVWGYAKGAARHGVEIHQDTEVLGISRENGRVTGVRTSRGEVSCGTVISCVAGWSTQIGDMVGVKLPIWTSILQACVTEPVKPFLNVVIVSSQMHVYISQTDRGEFLMGSEIEPYPTFSSKGTFPFIESLAKHILELFPQLYGTRILRQWTGLSDMTPDYSPILGVTEVEGFIMDCGWGTYGFKASPIVGWTLAELVATKKTPALIEPFKLERFYTDTPVSEAAAAAVSH